jgi:hypothetical protein
MEWSGDKEYHNFSSDWWRKAAEGVDAATLSRRFAKTCSVICCSSKPFYFCRV